MAFDYTKAFESENGFIVENGAGIFSGSDSPIGFDAPIGSRYYRSNNEVWQKTAAGVNGWVKKLTKSGVIAPTSFSGNPKTALVTFSTAMPSNDYMVVISGIDGRMWTFSGRTTNGFTVNANANQAISNDVYWEVITIGEAT